MDIDHLLVALRRDGAAFAEHISAAGLDAPVPSCEGWQGRDLLWHLTTVNWFWATIVAERRQEIGELPSADRLPDSELEDAYNEQFSRAVDVLSAVDPAEPVWTWCDDHTAGWVIRRLAHETAVHAWDAAGAAGHAQSIEPELASDGIDEFLTWFLPRIDPAGEPVGGSVHIHCADVAGEWTIRRSNGDYDVTREHAKGDCALRGPASNLILALWRRLGIDALDVVGDTGVASRFLAATQLG